MLKIIKGDRDSIMRNIAISVVVPIYRVEKYINGCVESILAQSFPDFELILVDDGSDDKCGEICDRYAEKDDRIVVVHKENEGLSCARNTGIEIARGEYIAFIDGDDSVNKDFLAVLYRLCVENNCRIGVCNFLSTDENSVKLNRQKKEKIEVITGKQAVDRSCTGTGSLMFTLAWNKLYHKNLFQDVRYPAGKIHEDDYTTWKLLWKSECVAITNLYLYYYLQRPDSIMGKPFEKKRLERLDAYEEKIAFLEHHGMKRAYEWLAITYYRLLWETHALVRANVSDQDAILEEISLRAAHFKEAIVNFDDMNVIEKNRIFYPYTDEETKKSLVCRYGSEWLYRRKEFFLFPFQHMEKGKKIALYGAGEVGKAFCLQLMTTGYGEVSLWVDERWQTIAKQFGNVRPVDAILRSEYDVLVIAISNPEFAEEIKNNLVNWGVPEQKIVWSDPRVVSEDRIRV